MTNDHEFESEEAQAISDGLREIAIAIDRLGFGHTSPVGDPGAIEGLTMLIRDGMASIADAASAISTSLDNVADAIREHGA